MTPSLGDLIRLAVDRGLARARVSMPGRVSAWDAAKQTATVEPLLQVAVPQEDGTELAVTLPPVPGVPVIFPGAGGLRITFPVAVGDTVLLLFADRALDRWKNMGGVVDPLDARAHALADAVAVVGLNDLLSPWTGVASNAITIGLDGATFQGAGLGNALATHLAALKVWLDALILPTPVGPAGPPAVPSPTIPTVESATVKVSP